MPASSGNLVAVDAPLSGETLETFDTVFVVASFEARTFKMNARIVDWLRRAARSDVRLGAIETGSEILMDAGLLRSESIPAHWYNAKSSKERHPDLKITETLFDAASSQPLSAGGTATVDMMLDLIALAAGDALATEIGKHLLLDGRRPGSRPQPSVKVNMPPDGNSPRHDDPVARAHAIMEQRIENPLSCAELAQTVGVSLRHLQRLFRARLGRGMEATYRELRFATAHQLVQQINIPLTEIAFASGFSALEVLSRTYRSRFGVAPSKDRKQTLDAKVYHSIN